jgi:Tfp pilus assembly protein PilX
MEEQKLNLENVPKVLILLIVLTIFVVVGATVLTMMQGTAAGTGASYSDNNLTFVSGQSTLTQGSCVSVSGVTPFWGATP